MKRIITDMDFEDDVSFYQTSRIVKICAVYLMLIICLGALAGIFGYGVWTKNTLGHKKDMLVEYECFLRVTKETPLTCYVNTNGQDSLIYISLSNDYLEKVNLKDISPDPCKVITHDDRLTFCFRSAPGKDILQPVSFITVAKESGNVKAVINSGRQDYTISQYIYP